MDSDSFIPQFWRASRVIGLKRLVAAIIFTEGIVIPEKEGLNGLGVTNAIKWLFNNVVRESVEGFRNKGEERFHGLLVSALGKKSSASLTLTADDEGETASANIRAGKKSRVLLSGSGTSDFMRAVGTGTNVIARGTAEVEYPGGSPESKPLEILHLLGSEPIAVVGMAATGFVMCQGRSPTTVTLKARNHEGASPAAGTKERIDWIAIA